MVADRVHDRSMPEISSTLSWAKPACDLPVVHSQTDATDKSDIDMDLGMGKCRTRVDDLIVVFVACLHGR